MGLPWTVSQMSLPSFLPAVPSACVREGHTHQSQGLSQEPHRHSAVPRSMARQVPSGGSPAQGPVSEEVGTL